MLRLFQRRGLLDEHTVASMLTWQAAGGFSLDASVRISSGDRAGRERLLRYCARPPFALERLRIERASPARSAGPRSAGTGDIRHVLYQPSRPTPDGRTLLVLSPLEFLAALARPIPRSHSADSIDRSLSPEYPLQAPESQPKGVLDFLSVGTAPPHS